jgi:hypothetical protein
MEFTFFVVNMPSIAASFDCVTHEGGGSMTLPAPLLHICATCNLQQWCWQSLASPTSILKNCTCLCSYLFPPGSRQVDKVFCLHDTRSYCQPQKAHLECFSSSNMYHLRQTMAAGSHPLDDMAQNPCVNSLMFACHFISCVVQWIYLLLFVSTWEKGWSSVYIMKV